MKCPFCAEEIQPDAKKCRHCGEWLTAPTVPGVEEKPAATDATKKTENKQAGGCCGCLFVLLLGAGFVFFSGNKTDSDGNPLPTPTAEPTPSPLTDDLAFATAEEAVKEKLKSPGSAKFPSWSGMQHIRKSGRFTVRSYVDSQNGFGALLRADFIVEMKPSDDRTYWVPTTVLVTPQQ